MLRCLLNGIPEDTRLGVCFCYWIIRQVSPQPPRLELIFCCSPSFARLVFFLSFSVSLVTTSHDYTSDQSSETVPTPSIPPPHPLATTCIHYCFPALAIPMVLIRTIYPLVYYPFSEFSFPVMWLLHSSSSISSFQPHPTRPHPSLLVESSY